jgi:nicotinate-nucleotide pyrophosphorylase (carboxylating)
MSWDIAELGDIERIIATALAEDLAVGDMTSRLTVPAKAVARGKIIAKQSLVVCGGPLVVRTFAQIDPALAVELRVNDGERVEPGTEIVALSGNARSLLAGERTALNLLGRGSGVATLTARYVEGRSCASSTRARPCRGCARSIDMRCAAVAGTITATTSARAC